MVNKSRIAIIPQLAIISFLLFDCAAELQSAIENPAKGKQTFDSVCAACHTIGGGIRVGPDLKDITNQRSATWLTDFISDPNKAIKSGDPVANGLLKQFHGLEMPDLGLSPEQVSDLLAYLKSTATTAQTQAPQPKAPVTAPTAQAPGPSAQAPSSQVRPSAPPAQAPPPQAPGPPAGALPVGSAATGAKLFSGLIPFQKGGPPCISCHDVARIPFPGGGTLGPDLTGAFTKYGGEGMNSVLATLPFPTMKPIFDHHPLTPQEQQDLAALLQKAGVESLISRGVQIGLAAAGGLLILIILVWIIWQNRLVTVRSELVERARKIGGTGK